MKILLNRLHEKCIENFDRMNVCVCDSVTISHKYLLYICIHIIYGIRKNSSLNTLNRYIRIQSHFICSKFCECGRWCYLLLLFIFILWIHSSFAWYSFCVEHMFLVVDSVDAILSFSSLYEIINIKLNEWVLSPSLRSHSPFRYIVFCCFVKYF